MKLFKDYNHTNIINPSGMGFEPMKPRHSIRDFQSLAIPLYRYIAIPLSDPDEFIIIHHH